MTTTRTIHTGTLPGGPDLLVETWDDGSVSVSTREHPGQTWSAPTEFVGQPAEVAS